MFDLAGAFSSHFQRKYNVTQGSERAIRPLVRLAKSSSALGDVLIVSQEVGQLSEFSGVRLYNILYDYILSKL